MLAASSLGREIGAGTGSSIWICDRFRWGQLLGVCSPIEVKHRGESLTRVGFFVAGYLFRRALSHDAASRLSAFGTEIDHPIGLFNDVEVVLDDQHGIAEVHQAIQDVHELLHVVEMQAGGGLIEDVKSAAGLAAGQLARQLDPLRFAAGKRGGRLAQFD